MKKRIILLLATGFGLGLSPVASGTIGSLPGVLIAVALVSLDWPWQAAVAVCLAAAAVPVCGEAEAALKKKDDGRIVADEYLTFPLCTIGLRWIECPWLLAVAFVTNRVMDVMKPPPARRLERMSGGAGVVLDDVVSALYALGLNHLIFGVVRAVFLV